MNKIAAVAAANVRDILTSAFEHDPRDQAVIVHDDDCDLANILSQAYRCCLPDARLLAYHAQTPEQLIPTLMALPPGSLVVLIQSSRFQLNAFRVRVELFKLGLKVIEHPHLARMEGDEVTIYIDSLAYDPAYFRDTGHALKQRIDAAGGGTIHTGDDCLAFDSPFESAKLNVGDYRHMRNIGGQFPIGEVFTEAKELEAVSGRIRIDFFGDRQFSVNRPDQAITLVVEHGHVTGTEHTTEEFERVLKNIRADEGKVIVRELGLGLNRAFSASRTVCDIGTFERMCGIHLSLGAKHHSYPKPSIRKRDAKHHVDVFVENPVFRLDDVIVFRDRAWVV